MSQFGRFIVVGILNTLLGYFVIFGCMYVLGISPEASNVTGYAVGLAASYGLNRTYTFRSTAHPKGEIARFVAVFLVAYATNFVALLVMLRWLGIHAAASQVLAGVLYVVASFLLNKYLVFRTALRE